MHVVCSAQSQQYSRHISGVRCCYLLSVSLSSSPSFVMRLLFPSYQGSSFNLIPLLSQCLWFLFVLDLTTDKYVSVTVLHLVTSWLILCSVFSKLFFSGLLYGLFLPFYLIILIISRKSEYFLGHLQGFQLPFTLCPIHEFQREE